MSVDGIDYVLDFLALIHSPWRGYRVGTVSHDLMLLFMNRQLPRLSELLRAPWMRADEGLLASVSVDVLLEVLREGEAFVAVRTLMLFHSKMTKVMAFETVFGSIDVRAGSVVTAELSLWSASNRCLHIVC